MNISLTQQAALSFLAIQLMLLSVAAAQELSLASSSRHQLGTQANRSASVRVGDIDGDGDLDVVVANGRHWPQQNFALLNAGAARFTEMKPVGTELSTSYACELADFDGDGDLDLATGNDMAPCRIYLNDSNGNFVFESTFGDPSSVRSLTLADVDKDGDTDILMTCRRRQNWIFLNDGQAGFETKIKFGTSNDSTINVAVGDVDDDGDNDLLLANRDSQPNAWLLNQEMAFSRKIEFGDPQSQSRAVVVGDFNGDQKLDWAVGNIGQPNQVFFGDGKGEVIKQVSFGSDDGRTYDLAAVDLDRDGDLDLVAGNVGQQNKFFLNEDHGDRFTTESFGEPDAATYGIDIGDLNGDGFPEIVTANSDAINRVFVNRLARRRGRNLVESETSVKNGSPDKEPANELAPLQGQQDSSAPLQKDAATQVSLEEFLNRPQYRTRDWPAFRGLGGRGVAEGFSLPETWNADPESGELKNILWQVDVPGLGHSSPVIHGDSLLILTAVPQDGVAELKVQAGGKPTAADDNGEQEWLLLCYDKNNGQEVWRQVLRKGTPGATRHAKATHANTSVCVASDKIVTFLGSEGLFCHDLNGKLIWKQDLGIIDISKYGIGWGFSSSPAVDDDRIALVCDDPKNPYLTVRSLNDGSEIWWTSRKDICERSWGTPLIMEYDQRKQIVVNGWPWIAAYDFQSGEEIWRCKGGGDNPVPTPFEANGLIYISSAHGGPAPVYAFRPSANGDVTDSEEAILWSVDRGGSYMSTPVVYHDKIYVGNSKGVLRSMDSNSGETVFQKRIGSKAGIIASLVAGDGKIYCASENGTVYVVEHGAEYNLLAKNKMADPILATPAISAGAIYIRTTKKLFAVAQDASTEKDSSSD